MALTGRFVALAALGLLLAAWSAAAVAVFAGVLVVLVLADLMLAARIARHPEAERVMELIAPTAAHLLGIPLVAPLLLLEICAPSWRRFFVKPDRYATADAQLLLAFLNLHPTTKDDQYLHKARQLGEEMPGYSIPGYSGLCWGYPFDWQHQSGMWGRNIPFITCTPYCYEAYCRLHDVTGDDRYREMADSIASFVFHDLRDMPTGPDAAAASYSPHDDSQVINASAYRAWVLFDAAERFLTLFCRTRNRMAPGFMRPRQAGVGLGDLLTTFILVLS